MTQSETINARTFVVLAGAAALALVAPKGAINSELERQNLPVPRGSDEVARASLLLAGVRSQGDYAAQVLNVCDGKVDPDDLTRALSEAFPGARIGKRHGPHYMSHARSGKLRGLRKGMVIPHRASRPRKSEKAATEAATEAVTSESLLLAHTGKEGRRRLQEMAKEMGLSAGGKTQAIAERIAEHTAQAA